MVPDLERLVSLPVDIGALLSAGRAEGHDLVQRLVDEWEDETNRFDQPGEVALAAREDLRLVAVGGLNRDPYLDDPTVGRIRHVFVLPDARGRGVGRVLVMALVDHARTGFRRVRLRTVTSAGSAFYRSLGFVETPDEADATHEVRF